MKVLRTPLKLMYLYFAQKKQLAPLTLRLWQQRIVFEDPNFQVTGSDGFQ